MDGSIGETQWVLGFDGGCGTCGRLAQELVALSGGKLSAKSLRSAEVQGWRGRALGPDAPWAPTLFAVEGEWVRAWTGKGLVARLARLVGPHKLWRIATIVGALMDGPEGPELPSRRLVLRQGIAGTAAALALLSGAGASPLAANAQQSGNEGAAVSAAGANERGWRSEKLKNSDFNDLERRAKNDRAFEIIREYFGNEHEGRGWRSQGREGYRYFKNGDRVRDVYWITFKNQGEDEWAHVMFGKESGGKENVTGLLWRGKNRRFTDRFFVQNGNLRREEGGRVDGRNVSAAQDETNVGCALGTNAPCVVGTGIMAGACMIPLVGIPACVGGSMVVGACYVAASVVATPACSDLVDG